MTMSSRSTVASVDPVAATRIAVDEGILALARDVGSIIAKHAETTERDRRLAPPVIDALRTAGLFRLFTPRALGGLEVDPVTFARVVEEVATFGIGERSQQPIVDRQEIEFGQFGEEACVGPVATADRELVQHARRAHIGGREAVPARALDKR